MRHTVIHAIFSLQSLVNTGNLHKKNGFCDWKHAMGKDGIISCHDRCKTHMQAEVAWNEYIKNKASGTSIANRLDAPRSQLIFKNRHYLKTILQILLVCSQQEIALQWHDESMKSSNRGKLSWDFEINRQPWWNCETGLHADLGMQYTHPLSSRMNYCT